MQPLARRPHPPATWDVPAVTTYRYNNDAVRTAGWRDIRYANGDEELHAEKKGEGKRR